MKKNIKQELAVFYANKYCPPGATFSLSSCSSAINREEGVLIPTSTLEKYFKGFGIVFNGKIWDFSEQRQFSFPIEVLESHNFYDKLLDSADLEPEEKENKKSVPKPNTSTSNVSSLQVEPTPSKELMSVMAALNKKIDNLVTVVDFSLNLIKADITELKAVNFDRECEEPKISVVTLENYRSISEKLKDENASAGNSGRTITNGFRTTPLFRTTWESFCDSYRIDQSDLVVALLSTFIDQNKGKPPKSQIQS